MFPYFINYYYLLHCQAFFCILKPRSDTRARFLIIWLLKNSDIKVDDDDVLCFYASHKPHYRLQIESDKERPRASIVLYTMAHI